MSGKSFEELDKEMVDKEQQVFHNIKGPEDIYAQYFYLYGRQFQNLVDSLSQRAVRRVLKAIVEYPLNEKEYQHTTEEEKNALLIGLRLLESKQMMILHSMTQHMEEEKKNKIAEQQGATDGKEENNNRVSTEIKGTGEA